MTSRKTRVDIARQTVNILERGEYSLPDGATVSIADRLKAAQDGTVLYEPADFAGIFAQIDAPRGELATAFHIENSTTFAAAKRLTIATIRSIHFASTLPRPRIPVVGFSEGTERRKRISHVRLVSMPALVL